MDAKWSWETIAKWTMVASMDSLKQCIQKLLSFLQEKLSTTPWSEFGWKIWKWMLCVFCWRKRRNMSALTLTLDPIVNMNEQSNRLRSVIIEFNPLPAFWNALDECVRRGTDGISFVRDTRRNLEQVHAQSFRMTEIWRNLCLTGEGFEAYFETPISMIYDISPDGRRWVNSTTPMIRESTDNIIIPPNFERIWDLFPFQEFRKFIAEAVVNQITVINSVRRCYTKYKLLTINDLEGVKQISFKLYGSTITDFEFYDNFTVNYNLYDDTITKISKAILSKYASTNIGKSKSSYLWKICLVDVFVLFELLTAYDPYIQFLTKNSSVKNPSPFSILGTSLSFEKLMINPVLSNIGLSMPKCVSGNNIITTVPQFEPAMKWVFDQLFPNDTIKNSSQTNSQTNSQTIQKVRVYPLYIYNSNLTMDEAVIAWETRVMTMSAKPNTSMTTNSKKAKVKTHLLKIMREIKETQIENPEYITWQIKSNIVDKLVSTQSNNTGNDNELIMRVTAFLALTPPLQTIRKEEITRKVFMDSINEVYKDMSTLYLRQEDHSSLTNALHWFRDKRDVLQSFGLPNKLGILLYGEPGTGKTSAIHGIASYLQKDIYYVSLNGIQTNEELRMLFDYVTKTCKDGGIIVMEDIDAMTPVVHIRTNRIPLSGQFDSTNRDLTVAEVMSSEDAPLTLEYFLNLLQGALTADGTMFIATTNHIDHLDPAFYRDGRFDLKIELRACDYYQLDSIYQKFIDRPIPMALLKRIPEFKFTPATVIFRVFQFMLCKQTADEKILAPFLTL
jgi:ATP-dependent 26S proteasome regulatory subunit